MSNQIIFLFVCYLSSFVFYGWTAYVSSQIKNVISLKQGLLSQPKIEINQYCQDRNAEEKGLFLCQTKIFYFYKGGRVDVCSSVYSTKRFFKRYYSLLFICRLELFGGVSVLKEKHIFKN